MNRDQLEQQLRDLGHKLPPPMKPVASYIPAKRIGNLIYVSGQLPGKDGQMLVTGPVGSKVSLEDAQNACRQCVLNGLAAAIAVGEISGVARVGGFVQCEPGYADQPKVVNGASDFLEQIFGESGKHVRAAVGTNALPLNASVEVEFIFTE